MKTEQFFKLNMNVSLTMNDLYDISDALFRAKQEYEKRGHNATAIRLREVYRKVNEQIDTINDICK